jgi:UDP-N-acetylglucosamine 2-epimerase (non-hydrolysing)/GDP/UDP-N,N'-diacetylbacillosamine 2-epimerase (hydrolysing)
MSGRNNMKNKKRKICFVTGTRADYGLMKELLKKISRSFDLSLIVVGMHLSPEFGNTVRDIEKDGFKIARKIESFSSEDSGSGMAKSLGLWVIKITEVLEKLKPDFMLVLGDRGEMLAGTIAASNMVIPIIHIHGGDQGDNSGHIDDPIRHAITKFAHIHFPATKQSAQRIIRMGEEKWRVHMVGSPALDDIYLGNFYNKQYLEKKYGLDLSKPLVIMIQHPAFAGIKESVRQIKETLEALKELNFQTVLIYPNSDQGGRAMIKVIRKYEKYDFLKTFKSLPRKDYLSLMKYTDVLVGNSSSGTIDAPSFKLPAINIGTRESWREHANNKIFVGYDRKQILKAIRTALYDKKFRRELKKCRNPYGDGKASERIVRILKGIKIDQKLLAKKITY